MFCQNIVFESKSVSVTSLKFMKFSCFYQNLSSNASELEGFSFAQKCPLFLMYQSVISNFSFDIVLLASLHFICLCVCVCVYMC